MKIVEDGFVKLNQIKKAFHTNNYQSLINDQREEIQLKKKNFFYFLMQ